MSVRGEAVVLALIVQLIVHLAWRRIVSNLREKIKAADDRTSEVLDVAEWDVKIEVRTMSSLDRSKMLKDAMVEGGTPGELDFEALYPAILVATCYDPETGEPIFTEADADWLNQKAAGPIERLAQAGMRLSGLTEAAATAGKGS